MPSTEGGIQLRVSSPPSGFSIFQTSAPRSASVMVHQGPARIRERSSTLMPSSAATIAASPQYVTWFQYPPRAGKAKVNSAIPANALYWRHAVRSADFEGAATMATAAHTSAQE